jgi:hypothetical protein
MLERIERLGVAQTSPVRRRRSTLTKAVWPAAEGPSRDAATAGHWPTIVLLVIAALGVLGVAFWGVTTPQAATWSPFATPAVAPVTIPWTPEPLPVPQASELSITRARTHLAAGRVHDALAILDRVPVGDPLRPEADRLRADAQQRLLSFAETERAPE